MMMKETLSGTILSINFHLTLSTRQNQILPLFLILYFRRREEIAEDIPAPAEDVPAPAPTHIKGWKIPTWRNFQASTSMLMQPHRWDNDNDDNTCGFIFYHDH